MAGLSPIDQMVYKASISCATRKVNDPIKYQICLLCEQQSIYTLGGRSDKMKPTAFAEQKGGRI